METEAVYVPSEAGQLYGAAGCPVANYRTRKTRVGLAYPATLFAGVTLMVAFQWIRDEGLWSLIMLALLGLVTGAVGSRRSVMSGLVIGLFVTCVNVFETLSGLRPEYKPAAHSLVRAAKWLVLMVPSIIAAAVGSYAGLKLRSARI